MKGAGTARATEVHDDDPRTSRGEKRMRLKRKRRITVRCSRSELREWKKLAHDQGVSLARLIVDLLELESFKNESDEEVQRERPIKPMHGNERLFFKPYEKQMREGKQ
jgi:hypothetical protein